MRRHLVTGVLLAVAAIIAYHFAYPDQASDPPAIRTNIAPAAESSSIALHGQPTRVPAHVTRLAGPDERQEIANRIAAAHTAAASAHAHSAPAAPALPELPADDTHDLDRVSAKALDALHEVIPFLADCYRTADRTRDGGVSNRAAVYMTMTGARDVGTLIDTDKMLDGDRQPIDPALGDCLKTTLESLELPPLAEGDSLKLQYSFVFD